MRDVHGLAAGRNEFRPRGAAASRRDALAVPGLNCDLFRNARAIRAVGIEFCDLSTLTAIEAVHLIAKGELRAEEYALRLLERQRALQSLNAVTWMEEERVLESARAIDRRRERGEPRGMLGGLPVIIQDNIEVAGTPTAAASAIFARNIRHVNATVAQRLFDAGAVFFGKANSDEPACGGTAAAIAAGLVPAGLGSAGPMARTVADVALLHAAITGRPQAPACDLRATRIGVPTAPYWQGIDPEMIRVAQNALIRLQAAGVKLVEVDARGYFSLASQTVFSPAQIEEARGQGRHRAVEAYTAMFAEHRLAAIVFPTHPIPVSKFRNTHVTSVLGAPGLSIPAGLTAQGLPVGLEFDALAGYDTELLALGIAVEQAWPKIPPPQPIP
jgi:indoleacetamide hydrolase